MNTKEIKDVYYKLFWEEKSDIEQSREGQEEDWEGWGQGETIFSF